MCTESALKLETRILERKPIMLGNWREKTTSRNLREYFRWRQLVLGIVKSKCGLFIENGNEELMNSKLKVEKEYGESFDDLSLRDDRK